MVVNVGIVVRCEDATVTAMVDIKQQGAIHHIYPKGSYFKELARIAKELDRLGLEYLAGLPEMDDDEVAERLWNTIHSRYKDPIDWDNLPAWWYGEVLDYHVPYYGSPVRGSLGHSLGMSLVSRSAHLRNLLEQTEGRESESLSFPVCACNVCNPEGHVEFDAAIAQEGMTPKSAPKGKRKFRDKTPKTTIS